MSIKKLLSEDVLFDLQDYLKNPYGFVLLTGLNGRGKTHTALHIYHHLTPFKLPAHDRDAAWFISQSELNFEFSNENQKYGSSNGLLEQAYKARFFVLDDLGTRTPSDAFMDFLYAIFDYRYNNRERKGTFITTNLTALQIREKFSDAVFSRIASGRIYVITGDDRRFENAAF